MRTEIDAGGMQAFHLHAQLSVVVVLVHECKYIVQAGLDADINQRIAVLGKPAQLLIGFRSDGRHGCIGGNLLIRGQILPDKLDYAFQAGKG